MKLRHLLPTALIAGGASVLILAAPDPAAAQQQRILITDLPMVEQARLRAEIADRRSEAGKLLQEARAEEEAGSWERAARLYEESARLRTDGDALGSTVFDLAGRAYYFGDRPGRASRMWEESGERAMIFGKVLEAAHAYMRAAVSAEEGGDRVRASQLGWKAYHLSLSPALTEAQRAELEGHLRVPSSEDVGG